MLLVWLLTAMVSSLLNGVENRMMTQAELIHRLRNPESGIPVGYKLFQNQNGDEDSLCRARVV